MTGPTPIGADKAARNLAEIVSILEGSGEFGRPVVQSGSNGPETLMRCPLCAGNGSDNRGRMLRVARRIDGSDLPYVGCRNHSEPEDWAKLRSALSKAGVPDRLLAGGKGGSGRPELSRGFPERPEGLGEADPVDLEAIEAWAERLWSPAGRRYLAYLRNRGLTDETIREAALGLGAFAFGPDKRPVPRLTIPIFGADGAVVNVRLASIKAGVKRLPLPHPEMLNEEGDRFLTYGAPTRLYGIDRLGETVAVEEDGDPAGFVYIVAGEYDKLLLEQEGFTALTGTGGEKALPWKRDGAALIGRDLVILYDCDEAGRVGARKFAQAALEEGARSVRIVDIEPGRDDGYDVADFLTEVADAADALIALVAETPLYERVERAERSRGPVWEFSDLGVAEQVAYREREVLRFVSESRTWIAWDEAGGVWQKYGNSDRIAPDNAVYEYVRETRDELTDAEEESAEDKWSRFLAMYLNVGKVSAATTSLSEIWDMRVSIDEIDAQRNYLNVANGTMDLETGKLFDAAPEDLLTKRTRGAILPEGPETDGEREWRRIIERTVPDPDTRTALQIMCGISLRDGNPLQVMVFLLGETGTGKSVFAELFAYALGSYSGSFNLSMFRDNQDERPRADLVRALTQRVIFASEASEQWRLHVDQIKRLTGEDSINARLPHSGEYVERIPAFTPWFRTNKPPHIESADLALFRRLIVFPFEQTYRGARTGGGGGSFVTRMGPIVADAVITWAVEGLLLWEEDGAGEIEKSAEMVLAEATFRESLNDLAAFLAEETEPDGAGRVSFKELYDKYTNWAFDTGVKTQDILSKKALGDRLSGLGYSRKESNSVTYRLGIVFKKTAKEVR